jgi:tRNA modification GTPase
VYFVVKTFLDTIYLEDTICAPATAVGGAVAMLRLSGAESVAVASRLWRGRCGLAELPPRVLTLGKLCQASGEVIDQECLAVRMPAPHSYTGEDVVELHCHGGALCAQLALRALLAAGCRLADPGEFSKRAFLNGRMDLTQAEAVADLIRAGSEAALQLANRQLDGNFGRSVRKFYDDLLFLLSEIESRLDFPEEDLEWQSVPAMAEQLQGIQLQLERSAASRRQGEILRGGIKLAIAGAPNVGKSSLLNAILGQERAIVSDIPGTTRDSIEVPVSIRGIPIHLIDTAPHRHGGDSIERIGIERTRKNLAIADLILWVMDASMPLPPQVLEQELPPGKVLYIANKADRLPEIPTAPPADFTPEAPLLYTCALDGTGLEQLYDAIEEFVWQGKSGLENDFAVSERHYHSLEAASTYIREATQQLEGETWELAAAALHQAISELGKITGQTLSDDILDQIFARFCIGK